jgi:hypothetical protein
MYRWCWYLQQNRWYVRKRTYQSDVQDTGERDVTVRQVREGALYVMRARKEGYVREEDERGYDVT